MKFKKGHKSWNEGLTKETDERLKNVSINNSKTQKRLHAEGKIDMGFQKGHPNYHKGIQGLDKDLIIKEYLDGKYVEDIAKIFKCSCSPIYRVLKESNMKVRKGGFQKGGIAWSKGLTKDTDLRVKKISIGNLGKPKSEEHVKKGVDTRNKLFAEGKLKVWNDGLTKETDERLKKAGEKGRKTRKKLFTEGKINTGFQKGHKGHMGNLGRPKTEKEIKKALETRNKHGGYPTGEKHPNWLGGLSFEPYTKEFNKQFKLAIRQRDGFMCIKCGMREEDSLILFKKMLHIHHIDYIKENTFKENCCALCLRCNTEVNSNRKSWTKFFQSLLFERYGYQYSETGEIILNLNQIEK